MQNIVIQIMCFISIIHSQYINNRHANKQLVNSENWTLKCSSFTSSPPEM